MNVVLAMPADVRRLAAPVVKVNVPALAVVECAIEDDAYVAYDRGAGLRPDSVVAGVPQVLAKDVGGLGQELPAKPVVTALDEPRQVARVTSVQEDEPGVLPVPAAHATQAADVLAAAPPKE